MNGMDGGKVASSSRQYGKPHVTFSFFFTSFLFVNHPLSASLSFLDESGVFPSEDHAATTQTKRKINTLSLWHLPAGNRGLRRLNKSEQRTEYKNERC